MKSKAMRFAKKGLPWLVLLAAYLLSVGLFARYGMHNVDSDMASEMILADMLNEEGTLFSEEWYYSTELRVVSPVPLYQLGLKLFDSWHDARTFAVAMIHLGVILSLLFMARGAGMKEGAVYCAAALILPISQAYTVLFAYGGYYTAYFMMICLVIGVMLRMHASRRKPLLCLLMTLFMALSGVWSGMTGVRMLMNLGVPLVIACSAALFQRIRCSASGKEVAASEECSMMLAGSIHFAGMLAGYWINGHILAQKYSFHTYEGVKLMPFGPQNVLNQIQNMFGFFGYESGRELLSLEGIASWASIGLVCFGLFSVYHLLKRGEQYEMTVRQRMVPLFALCALAVGILTNESTDRGGISSSEVYAVAYYIAGVLMMLVSAFMLLEKLPCRIWKGAIRSALLVLLSMVFFLEARVYTKNYYRSTMANYEDAAQWLLENGYTQGFSTFWFGNVLTEASDGQIEMYTLARWTMDDLFAWLQKKSHLEQLPEGKVFVYVDSMQDLLDPCACADEQRMIYENVGGRAYEYDSAQEVMEIQRVYRASLQQK